MDILHFSVLFLTIFACTCLGKEDPFVIEFQNSTQVDLTEGAKDINFQCHVNRKISWGLNHQLEIVHVNPVTKKETVLTSSGKNVDGKPEFYTANIDTKDTNEVYLKFSIKTVRSQDDGKFICRTLYEGKTHEAEKEVVVHRPLTALNLQLGDKATISKSLKEILDIDPGKYQVKCIAEGSNPGTDNVHMYLGGEKIAHSNAEIVLMTGINERRFRTTIIGEIDLKVKNSGNKIMCQASDSSGSLLSTNLGINVTKYETTVSCNDSEAYHEQANPILQCTVNHTGIPVEGYSYQLGDSGDVIKAGAKNDKNIVVTQKDIAPGITVVSMDLHKAEMAYLDKNYYILIDVKGGHTNRASVRLNKIPVPAEMMEPAKPAPEPVNIDDGPKPKPKPGDGTGGAAKMCPATLLPFVLCLVVLSWL